MEYKSRDSVLKNNQAPPQTVYKSNKKRSLEELSSREQGQEDELNAGCCASLKDKEVTIRTNYTMTVKEPIRPHGLKVELVIKNIDFEKNSEMKRTIMKELELLGKNFFDKQDFAGGCLKCYPEDGNMVVTVKVAMPFDVKAMHYIFLNAVGKNNLKYDKTFASLEEALEKAKQWFNKGDHTIRIRAP